MIFYASYVCFLYFRFIENHPIDLEATNPSFLRWFWGSITQCQVGQLEV
jgi:hypothetical protein